MIGLSRNISYPVRLEEEIIKPGKVTWHGLTTGPMNSEINLICFVVAPRFLSWTGMITVTVTVTEGGGSIGPVWKLFRRRCGTTGHPRPPPACPRPLQGRESPPITERPRECAAHTALMGDGVAMATMPRRVPLHAGHVVRRLHGQDTFQRRATSDVRSSLRCEVGRAAKKVSRNLPSDRCPSVGLVSDGARAQTEQLAAESASGSLSR
ncbi:hypothetical protein THAOC_06300 [Thalassiosira oceanica]|uniref:Uncharacterized protein n=1 Tax=Thalassiosira oceanica TaxID=159749 RepID=K0TF91_THAOC|nr:hypothetical protein THAOC_06300 [Thalassiosira oceanica]|eukprot:EJK72191.1 hypothetical protein THAOC_06300 [Thalassiosira oceanica]